MPAAPRPKSSSARSKKVPAKPGFPEHIRLTSDRIVVISPLDGERRTKGGLLIPATAGPSPKRCVWADVALVGPDTRNVKAGDKVLFLPHVGMEVEIEGEEYVLLRERDVQAIAAQQGDGKDHTGPGQYL
jgi:chaperonin GroES